MDKQNEMLKTMMKAMDIFVANSDLSKNNSFEI
jgi:hypothetical protein